MGSYHLFVLAAKPMLSPENGAHFQASDVWFPLVYEFRKTAYKHIDFDDN